MDLGKDSLWVGLAINHKLHKEEVVSLETSRRQLHKASHREVCLVTQTKAALEPHRRDLERTYNKIQGSAHPTRALVKTKIHLASANQRALVHQVVDLAQQLEALELRTLRISGSHRIRELKSTRAPTL